MAKVAVEENALTKEVGTAALPGARDPRRMAVRDSKQANESGDLSSHAFGEYPGLHRGELGEPDRQANFGKIFSKIG
jgi:hypothetical protein